MSACMCSMSLVVITQRDLKCFCNFELLRFASLQILMGNNFRFWCKKLVDVEGALGLGL